MTHWQGQFDMHRINTAPGAPGPFAPQEGWEGTAADYRLLLRERYASNLAAKQQIAIVSLRRSHIAFSGPWATEAQTIINAIAHRKAAA
jgi:hypothetical protein